MASDKVRIIGVIGENGSGKDEVLKYLRTKYNVPFLSTGDIVRGIAAKEGVDLGVVYEVLTHSTGDCTAIRTRIPFEGVRPDTPASNDWKPGFMTALMTKDVDLVLSEAARMGVPAESAASARTVLGAAIEAGFGREDFSALGKIVRERAGV